MVRFLSCSLSLSLHLNPLLLPRLNTLHIAHPFSSLPADGSIFEVVSKGQQVSITSFDVNMDTGTDTVSVYSRPGNLVASDDGNWLLIKSFEVTGQGKGLATTLPYFDFPVVVPAGFKQSFYVATNSTGIDFWYSPGTELGHAFASNDDLDILEGYAIGNAWKGFAFPRQWNGAVHYSVGANVPTASPIFESTSAAPSLKVCQYVSAQKFSLLLQSKHLAKHPIYYVCLATTIIVNLTSSSLCHLLSCSPLHTPHYCQL